MTKVEKFKEFLKSVGDEKGWDDSTLRKALRIAERRSRKSSHDDAAPGHMMIPILEWLRVWHDKDKDGNEFKRYGIAVGPPQEQPKREELEKEEKTIIGSDSNRDLRTTPRSGGNVFGQGELTDLKRPYAYGTGQGPRTDEDYPARRVKEYKPSNEEGWGCEEPPCEWGLAAAGAENMHMEDAGGLTTIHDQTEWERAHPDRWERSDTKGMNERGGDSSPPLHTIPDQTQPHLTKPDLTRPYQTPPEGPVSDQDEIYYRELSQEKKSSELMDYTYYRQAYGRWRTKPDVLGERRIRQAYERRDPPDQLAIENDEEFRTLNQSGTKERFYGNNAPLPYEGGLTPGEELEDQSGLFPRPSWKQLPTCPDGRVENPAIRTCVGTEGARGGVTNIDEMHIESNSPHIGEGKSAWTRRCPDGRKFPLGSGTCGGRYGDSWDGVISKDNDYYNENEWHEYPDYAPVVGVDVRDEDEREKPIVGPAALEPRFRKNGVPGQHPSLPNQTLPNPTAPNRTEPNLTTGLGDVYYRRSQVKAKNNAAVRTSPYAWWKALERFGYGGDVQIGTKASTWKGPGKEPGRARFVQARTVSPTPRQSSPPQHEAQPATPTSSGQLVERAATQKQPTAPKPEALPAYLPWSGEPGPKQEETYAAQPPVQRQEGTPFTQFKPKVAREIPKTQNPPHVPAGLEVEEVERSRPISTEELQFVAEKVGKRPEEIDPKNLTFEEQVALGNLRATWRAGHAPFTPPPLPPEEVNELARFMGIKPSKINPKKLTSKQKDAYRQYFGEEPPGERPGSQPYEGKTYKNPQHMEWMQPGDLQWLEWLTPAEYKLNDKGEIQLYKEQEVPVDVWGDDGKLHRKMVKRYLPTNDPDGEPMLVGGQEWVNEKFPDGEFTYNGRLALPQGLRYLKEGIDKKTGEKLTKEDIKKKQRNFRITFENNKQMAWDRKEMVQENPGLLERYYQFGAQGLPSDREVKEYIKEKKRQEKERDRSVSGEVQHKMRTVYEGMVDRLLGSETGQRFPPQVREILAASSTGALEVPQLDENASPEEVKKAMGLATVAQFGKNFVDMMFRKVRRAREKMIAQNPGSMASAKRRHTSGDQYELDQASSLATGYMWELLFQPLTEGETDLKTGKATGKPWTWEQLMERIGPMLYEWQRNPDGTVKRDPKTKKPIPEIASKKDVNPRYKGDKKRVEWLKNAAGNLEFDSETGEPIQVEVDTNQGTRTVTGKKRQIQGKVKNPKTGKEVIATYPNGDKKYKRVPFNWEYEIADNGEVVKIRERPVEEVLGHLFNLMGLSAAFEALDAEEFKGKSKKVRVDSLDALAAKLEKSASELAAQGDEAQGRQREPGQEFAEEEATPNYETHPQAAVKSVLNTFLKSTWGGSYGSRRNYLTNLWRQEEEARKRREKRTGKKEERNRDDFKSTMIGPNVQMLPVVADAIFDRVIAKLDVMNRGETGVGEIAKRGEGSKGSAIARTEAIRTAIYSTVNDDNERIREGEQPELPRDVRRFLLRLINGKVTNDREKTVTLDTYSRKMGEFFLIMNILARKDVERDKDGKIIATADQIAMGFARNHLKDGDLTKILGPYFEARGSTDETEIREAQTKRRLPPQVGPKRAESHDPTKEKMRERMEEARLRRMGGGKSLDWDEEGGDLDSDLDDQWGEVCPDGSPMSPNTNTCAGREGWVPYTEDERRTETLSEPPKEGIGPKVRHPIGGKSYPAVPLSPFGRKGFKNRYQKGPDFFDQRLVG